MRGAAVCGLLVLLAFVPIVPPGSLRPASAQAAGACTGWTSDTVPPAAIRVLRTAGPAAGFVQAVPFHDYVAVVMAAEWGSGNPPEALKAGAVAVKEYAWYHAMFWRGGSAADGSCYDVVDSSRDQIYSPETRTPATSHLAAVDATWATTVRRNTGIFATHYQAGANVACGVNADGTNLYQLSATHCAQDGMTFDLILGMYYGPGVEIANGPPAGVGPAGLRFMAQPSIGTAGVAFPIQPVIALVDATGQTVTGDASNGTVVSLALAAATPDVSFTCTGGPSRATVAGLATFDGCLMSGAAVDVVLVASAGGLASISSAPFQVAAPAPSLSLLASSPSVRFGDDVQFAAELLPDGPAMAGGRTLRVERSVDGIAWEPLADVVTDASGQTSLVDQPTSNTFYRLVFDGAPDMSGSTSPVTRVLVRNAIELRPDNRGAIRRVSRGAAVPFTATVQPAAVSVTPGNVEFRLYQFVGRTWVVKRTWSIAPDPGGTARLRVVFGTRGSWSVRALARATRLNAISVLSPAQRYTVR